MMRQGKGVIITFVLLVALGCDSREHRSREERRPIETPSPPLTREDEAVNARNDSIARVLTGRERAQIDSYLSHRTPEQIRGTPARASMSKQETQFAACHVITPSGNDERELRDCLVREFHWNPAEAITWARDSTLR
jgi:hypothetical protein